MGGGRLQGGLRGPACPPSLPGGFREAAWRWHSPANPNFKSTAIASLAVGNCLKWQADGGGQKTLNLFILRRQVKETGFNCGRTPRGPGFMRRFAQEGKPAQRPLASALCQGTHGRRRCYPTFQRKKLTLREAL